MTDARIDRIVNAFCMHNVMFYYGTVIRLCCHSRSTQNRQHMKSIVRRKENPFARKSARGSQRSIFLSA